MALAEAAIPSASSDVIAIFPEAPPINIPDIGTFSIPNIGSLPDITEIPGFIPVQVFGDARPMKVSVAEPSTYMTHPLENGAQQTDHRIINPVELTITFVLRANTLRTTYFLMRQAYIAGLRFSVQTRVNTYTGMYMSDFPHEEDIKMFNTITMAVKFREVQFFETQSQELSDSNVANPIDASTVERGIQQPQTPTSEQNESGSTLFRALGSFF